MFTKTAFALAFVLATAAGALAATKTHSIAPNDLQNFGDGLGDSPVVGTGGSASPTRRWIGGPIGVTCGA